MYIQRAYLFGLTLLFLWHWLTFFFLLFHKRVELKDRERFPESRPAKEKPFRMYNDNTVIIVKLTSLEDGWKLDKTNDTQV